MNVKFCVTSHCSNVTNFYHIDGGDGDFVFVVSVGLLLLIILFLVLLVVVTLISPLNLLSTNSILDSFISDGEGKVSKPLFLE